MINEATASAAAADGLKEATRTSDFFDFVVVAISKKNGAAGVALPPVGAQQLVDALERCLDAAMRAAGKVGKGERMQVVVLSEPKQEQSG